MVTLLVGVLFLPACGSSSGNGQSTSKVGSEKAGFEKTVLMRDNYFEPATLKVQSGETVLWKNTGVVPHNVTSSSFASELVEPDGEYKHQFSSTPGVYKYRCTIHPGMNGEVTVEK